MNDSLVYSVTVTFLHYLYKDEPRVYSPNKTRLNCDIDCRCSLFRTLESAKKRIDEYLKQYAHKHDCRVFSISIDEFEEGADITVTHPKRSWYYDDQGMLVKELARKNGRMLFASEKGLPNVGDIVELPISPTSIGLGIVVSVPIDRNDYIGNLSKDPEHSILAVSYDPRCYNILMTKDNLDFIEYEATDFMPYSGNHGNADFMTEIMDNYRNQQLL